MSVQYYVAMSLDGFIATKDGSIDWLEPFQSEAADFNEFFDDIQIVVMGRKTYDFIADYGSWPYAGRKGYVLTSGELETFPDADIHIANAGIEALLEDLSGEEGNVWIVGGGKTVSAFLGAGRVDILDIFVVPVLLGDGIPAFAPFDGQISLRLENSEDLPSGMQRLTYSIVR